MLKRISYFLLMNIAVLLMITVIFNVLKIDPSIRNQMGNFNVEGTIIVSLIYGFVGAFISLLMSKFTAKMMTGAVVIKTPKNEMEAWLMQTVEKNANIAGIPMPEVAIFHGDANAFATGASKKSSLVAVSDGLLNLMDRREAEAVICHELSHIKNGDMVTMTLLQGVLNAFVIFFSRLIAFTIDKALRGKDSKGGGLGRIMYPVVVIITQILLGIFATILLMAFSRKREYAADKGSAEIMGEPSAMIKALEKLDANKLSKSSLPKELAAFGISGGEAFTSLFRSHPKIEERITALKNS